ncbi:MAG: amidohydrolase [Chlorobium sp.]|uniref:M20 metallopeptidase family protein n=1 Tax=Chlorobium sp. TaxID=1095 RepID=UPI0025C4FD2C|nr:M20 family metallopeptidase [Chlorobium sp.]MCF8217235.1 amidohydrolase [Chlorobium sp.]MCF8272093.1 amidohydrolase [Chlorobium sp.]MCF8288454.1 amidohydrolase [Chlorobium sp.]MCF8292044.1 amidohydrolase [Chlorobium sp.]MCF8386146.1 amidohydrolase [Chlorobium sp.]
MNLQRDNSLVARILDEARSIFPDIVGLRRDIHAHPELSYEEFHTTELIANRLRSIGIEPEPPILETGVIALIKGSYSEERSGEDGPARTLVALRSDIDALPVNEENSHGFCSLEPGKMHACGHDMHTAMLFGAAQLLLKFRNELHGDVLLIFQPAEEKAPGGARPLIEAGLFERFKPQAIFGQHCFPSVEAGKVALSGGSFMAATDELYITVNGRGGHASAPHKAADPVLASAHIVTAVQHLVSRVAPPHEPAVVSIASIHGGNAPNVIPSTVTMSGTMRTMNESLRARLKKRLKETVIGTAAALGVNAELEIRTGYPALINDAAMTDEAEGYCVEFLGKQNVLDSEPLMTAEDFAYYLQQIPGTFWQIGTGDGQAEQRGNTLHSSTFDPDEQVLAMGAGLMAYIALRFFM